MVTQGYWEALSSDEKEEYNSLSSIFIREVMNSGTMNGRDFCLKYHIFSGPKGFYIAKHDGDEPLGGIFVRTKKIAETLMADAGQNYGR